MKLLLELVVLANSILKVLRLKKPGMVFLKIVGEQGTMLQFKLILPAPGASDVVKRELIVKVGEGDLTSKELPGTAVESEVMSGSDNDSVTGTLVDIDDAGNSSSPRDFSFVLTDTLPPPQPGEIGMAVVSEV